MGTNVEERKRWPSSHEHSRLPLQDLPNISVQMLNKTPCHALGATTLFLSFEFAHRALQQKLLPFSWRKGILRNVALHRNKVNRTARYLRCNEPHTIGRAPLNTNARDADCCYRDSARIFHLSNDLSAQQASPNPFCLPRENHQGRVDPNKRRRHVLERLTQPTCICLSLLNPSCKEITKLRLDKLSNKST